MAGRRLGADEQALWRKVTATVRPLAGKPSASSPSDTTVSVPSLARDVPGSAAPPPRPSTSLRTNGVRKAQPGETLDGGWDRRLRRGVVEPDMTIDLHGHTLATAHAALDHALARATGSGARVMLLVTGKPPRQDASGRQRGLIRASIFDWLGSSRFAGRIAAVRNAHPRHGGAGALYIIFRRERSG